MSGKNRCPCRKCGHKIEWTGPWHEMPKCPKCYPSAKPSATASDDVGEFVDQCESLLSDIDDLPDRAEDFAIGVEETVRGIMNTVEESGRFTENQESAIENIAAAVGRWLDR